MSDNFTSSSGIGFDSSGAFNCGMEVFFNEMASPSIVSREIDVPADMKQLTIFGGSAGIRPKDPEHQAFGTLKCWKCDVLFRVYIDGVMIVNIILKGLDGPQNLAVPSFMYVANESIIATAGRKARVEFQEAGAGLPVNAELEMCGMWA